MLWLGSGLTVLQGFTCWSLDPQGREVSGSQPSELFDPHVMVRPTITLFPLLPCNYNVATVMTHKVPVVSDGLWES